MFAYGLDFVQKLPGVIDTAESNSAVSLVTQSQTPLWFNESEEPVKFSYSYKG